MEFEFEDTEKKVERCLAFLDTILMITKDGTIRTRVFRKETHTDQHLNFDTNPLEHNRGVVRTLTHRPRCIVNDWERGYFWIKHDLGQKYYTPQVGPDRGSNSRLLEYDSTFHVTETLALTTWPSVTPLSGC